jgi:hypothetical protein
VFWLPPESGAKMVLGMNIFTSFFLLLLLLSKSLPSASDQIPLIGAYYCLNMVIIATSTIGSTLIVHIYYRGQYKVPWIIRKIFLNYLAKIFFMDLANGQSAKTQSESKTERTNIHLKICSLANEKSFRMRRKQSLNNYEKNLNRDICFSLNLIKNDTKEIRDYLSHTQKKLANIDSKLKHSKEWKQIALVLDRFLFFLYFIGIAISASVLLL